MRTNEMNTQIEQLSGINPYQCASMQLLDEEGREIPITEEMIMQACDDLMARWQYPSKAA
jgi:hypothetical protein